MICKAYEVDPRLCPEGDGQISIIAFLTDYFVADRVINHLKLTFAASKPPPPWVSFKEVMMVAETSAEYFS
jgi:hypothetical protein